MENIVARKGCYPIGRIKMKKVLIIMGAGSVGVLISEDVVSVLIEDYDEVYFYDNDIKKQGTYVRGRGAEYYVLSLQELLFKKETEQVSVILATDQWQELCIFCEEHDLYKNIIAIYNKTDISVMGCYRKGYYRLGYGQDGEDLYLQELAEWQSGEKGFYVDIGANHPIYASTTWLAYQHGWSGINIEPNEVFFPLFNQLRIRDINLNCGVAETEGVLNYYKFNSSVYNTFDKKEFEGKRTPKEILKVPVYRLERILEENNVKDITFMNIDVEGMELEVLRSNDWSRWRPKYLFIEQKNMSVEGLILSDIYKFLKEIGYRCNYLNVRTAIYQLKEEA